ncbi:PadR family transcriptional regulator [Nocardioides anomalus]|uniref:PadR family transcriptional regulator n=1 Tax=Nocardioides anomalus TaxID=2712223 RepID=A0A6G6W8Y2_9ACTN|nr:PadR family transcriptional regulator [Nocardioides anomalus]QIG41684.1 PadR family transcriptional regulator [Nocardioides anomalus]
MVAAEATAGRASDLLRGVLDLCVLALLHERPSHTYGLVERLREGGFTDVGYGAVYPLTTRLRRRGLLVEAEEASPTGPPRKVLSLTAAGEEALASWRAQWDRHVAVTDGLLVAALGEAGPRG